MMSKTPATHLQTKILLSYLEKSKMHGGKYSPCATHGPFYTTEELIHALKSKPHIPHKQRRKQRK